MPDDEQGPELWQLEPETPVPKELVFKLTPETPEVKIKPVFSTVTSQQFLKVCLTDELNCMNEDITVFLYANYI